MNACLVLLGLMIGCASSTTPPADDRWIAEDKLRHLTLSFAATTLACGGARMALDRGPARASAGAAAVAAGLAKEVLDVHGGGTFGLRDVVWDLAGVALGLALANHTR